MAIAAITLATTRSATGQQGDDVTVEQQRGPVASAIAAQVDTAPTAPDTIGGLVAQYYLARQFAPAWIDGPARNAASRLLVQIAAAQHEGLCAATYAPHELRERLHAVSRADAAAAAALDVELTRTVLRYVVDVGLGGLGDSARELDLLATLDALRYAADPAGALLEVTPRHDDYARLRDALARYRGIARHGGWPQQPDDVLLRPGDEATPALLGPIRRRLVATGDLDERVTLREAIPPAGATSGEQAGDAATATPRAPEDRVAFVYDGALVDAVRRFQQRHGLLVDGIVGPETAGAMNVPVEARVRQIAVNMERWRRLPDALGETHVRVNIPGFRLRLIEGGREALEMRVVVGTPRNQTPVFSDRIEYLQFRPYWNVPASITREEIAPKAARDPGYLARHGYEVLEGWNGGRLDPAAVDWDAAGSRYRIRQRPGPGNALGLVKFMFPNRYSVYLHDTPQKRLFARHRRAFSHGCVRVADPAGLAAALLREQGWTEDQVTDAMHGRRRAVRLDEPVPVHLLYFTAWADEGGTVQFRRDLYGRDARVAATLECG